MKIWDLPGPSNFISTVIGSLQDGKSVCLSVPCLTPPLIDRQLFEKLGVSGFVVDKVDFVLGRSPLAFLYKEYDLKVGDGENYSLDVFIREVGSSGKVIFLRTVEFGESYHQWTSFLMEYEGAARSIASFMRARFLLLCSGVPESNTLKLAAAVDTHRWNNVISSVDMYAYCGSRMIDIGIDSYKSRLLVHMITALSMWDLELADVFLSELKSVYSPISTLLEYAKSRNWGVLKSNGEGASWHSGTYEMFDGEYSEHAAWLAIQNETNKVERILWAAQVAVLLPKIESHRQVLAPVICEKMVFPYNKDGYSFNDVYEVEIGSLAYFASQQSYLKNGPIPTFTRKLRDLRNDLAHLRILDESRATDIELLQPFDVRRR